MLRRKLTQLGLVIGVLCLIVPPVAAAQGDNIGNSMLTNVTPDPIPPGAVQMCFTVNVQSDDFEYMDRFDVDLPDHWTIDLVYDSVPAASGCPAALPPVSGTEAGNVVYWQAAGTLPTGCGAWEGGSAPGTDYTFCVDVTVPDPRNEPWSFDWNVLGDTYGNDPHSAAGTYGPVPFDYGDAVIELTKTVGTVPGVCAATDAIDVLPGTDVYYCYTVYNPTFYTFEMHDLADDQLGTLFTDLAYTLGPMGSTEHIEGPVAIYTDTTNEGTWSARIGDPSGFSMDDTVAYDFIDISGSGTALGLSDDGEANITLPFDFTLWDRTSANLRVGNNGGILVGVTTGDLSTANGALPRSSPAYAILPFWDDIDSDTGNVYWEVQGTAPNRIAIIEWYDRPHFSNTGSATFEVILYEGSNEILFQYADVVFGSASYDNGVSATVGLNQNASNAKQYSNNEAVIFDQMAILFTPVVGVGAEASDTASVNVQIPDINVSPSSLASSQRFNTQTMHVLDIANDGDLELRWEIGEEYTSLMHPGGTSRIPPANDKPTTDIVLTPNPNVDYGRIYKPAPIDRGDSPDVLLTITHSATQNIVSANSVSCNSAAGHADNSYIRAFDLPAFGIFGDFNVTEVEVGIETATGPVGGTQPATVNLYTWNPVDPFQFAFFNPIGTANVMVPDQTGTILTVPVAGYAPAGSVLVVELFTPNGQTDGNFLFVGSNPDGQTAPTYLAAADCGITEPTDTAVIGFPGMMLVMNVTGDAGDSVPCVAPSDIPWLSLSTDLGTTAPGATSMVDVTLDSTGLAPGDYTGNLCIASNDPDPGPGNHTELVAVPVTLTVTGNPAISLNKTVGTTPGVCAATDSVSVSPGTDIYFCYEVTNTGDVGFAFHTLVDDQLGGLLANAPQSLPPGASYQYIEPATATVPVVNTGTWAASNILAEPGYAFDDTYPYSFVDISATGTPLGLSDDGEANITLPFPFTFYGVSSSDLRVGNNGGILFNATSGDLSTSNGTLPRATPAYAILPFWDDIDSDTGDVYWEVQGTAPNRMAIVEWYNRPHFSNVGSSTFELILFEGTNQILFQYQDVDFGNPSYDWGASATVGLNMDATNASQYSYNAPVITDGMAIMWSLEPYLEATAQDTAEVMILIPNIDVSPLNLGATLITGNTTTRSLDIANTGEGDLNWNVEEENLTDISYPPMGGTPGSGDPAAATEPDGTVFDGKPVEPTEPPLIWERPDVVLYDNGPLVNSPGTGVGGADESVLQTTSLGMNTLGFGAQFSAGNRVADDFEVTDPAGWFVENITFFAYQTGSTTTSTLTGVNLQIWDGPPDNPASAVVWGDTSTNVMTGTAWSNIYRVTETNTGTNVDRPIMAAVTTINTLLPAGTYWLDWQFDGTLASGPWAPPITINGQAVTGNALQWTGAWAAALDSGTGTPQQGLPFVVEGSGATLPCSLAADIPWLSLLPTSGSTAAGTFDTVDVTFDATGLADGTYTANLCVYSNDPDPGPGNGTELVPVPVSLDVRSSGPYLELTKTVGTTPGVCAATDNITVITGTTVYYCYVAENTGTVTFNFHDLDDDLLGMILDDFPYTLDPGTSSPPVIVPHVVTGPSTNTATWTAADAIGGYAVDDTIAFDFEDISATGTAFTLSDDEVSGALPVGFDFDFYGTTYGNAYISSNGFLTFIGGGSNGCCTGEPIPTPGDPDGLVAGWWEDLDPGNGTGAALYYETLGTAPNRRFVVQFANVEHYPSGNFVTMEYKLFESTNIVEVHYQAAPSDGGTHSAGVENADGTIGVQYYLGGAALTTPLAVQYTPTETVQASAMDSATVNTSDPDIDVDPMSLLSAQNNNVVVTLPLDVNNVGTADLIWTLDEAPPISIPPSDGNFPRGDDAPSFGPVPSGRTPNGTGDAGNGLEYLRGRGTLAYATDASFTNHVYFDVDLPGTLNVVAPATGAFWAGDFVGGDLTKTYQIKDTNELVTIDVATGAETVLGTLAAPPAVDESYTGMTFDPVTGNVYASSCNITVSSLFQIDVVAATATRIGEITNSPCSIAIAADGDGNLFTYDIVNDSLLAVDKATGAGTIVGSIGFDANFGQGMDFDAATGTMYMSAFNNGTFQPELRVVDLVTGNSAFVGVLGNPADLDQLGWVAFASGTACSSPADVPWLSVNPVGGTVAPAGTTTLDVTFDSTGYGLGIYDAVLCIRSNDPDEALVEVPVTMDVLIPVELQSFTIE